MTRLTFGVSASSFAAIMAVKQNAINHTYEYPLRTDAVEKSFYVDDCQAQTTVKQLSSFNDNSTTISLLGDSYFRNGDSLVLQSIPEDLRDSCEVHPISETNEYTKTLGLEWNVTMDQFHLTITNLPSTNNVTKQTIVSDTAKIFDMLGCLSPVITKMKILFQRLWEHKVDQDDPVPKGIYKIWLQWRSELRSTTSKPIPHCYSPKEGLSRFSYMALATLQKMPMQGLSTCV